MFQKAATNSEFLEVTVNSNGLITLLQSIMKQLTDHSSQIHRIQGSIPNINFSFSNSIAEIQGKTKKQFTQVEANRKTDNKKFEEQRKQIMDQILKNKGQFQRKLKDQNERIVILDSDLKKLQYYFQINEEKQKKVEALTHDLIEVNKNKIETLEMALQSLDKKFDDQFEMVVMKFQSMFKNQTQNRSAANRSMNFEKVDAVAIQRRQTKNMSSKTALNWAQFSQKMDKIDNKIKENEFQLVNKVLFSKKSSSPQNTKSESPKIDEQQEVSLKIQKVQKYYQNIQKAILEDISKIKCQVQTFQAKIDILEENNSHCSRKIEKQAHRIGEVQLNLKKYQERSSEGEIIEMIRVKMIKKFEEFQSKLEDKTDKSCFEREIGKINEKNTVMHENILEKADKGEMKQAFIFMEEKIKQIVVLIAKQLTQQKEGAIRKLTAKCLSCDKQVEGQNHPQPRATTPQLWSGRCAPRSASRNIRKRNPNNSAINLI